ncbi:tRNA lysidine(34) synthetase TilS [Weissella soli]|uniref:tRNA lysidine(34) synthetase TilS n=1 Tax=Weissella soli TaxID=155866 RepID=UPI0011BB3B3B|nr:tRNA lysidine(34) synthetase TilS [Weissella soli]MCT8395704.1 tRNA lysidine(34) synthetase TilS [Weissella soli]QEA35525.1 tRNA lysidine(34) synthetase TilS [Weissella soli]
MKVNQIALKLIKYIRENQLFSASDHVVVAFSGGYDSLHLATWLTDGSLPVDLQPRVSLVYINHGLRSDADIEEAFVEDWLAAHGQRFENIMMAQMDWDEVPRSGVEGLARERRYEILQSYADLWKASKVITAHHRDDQAETILFKLIRGSRLAQLAGMTPTITWNGLTIVRPLLQLAKHELPNIVAQPITHWIEDSTNADLHYARNRIRRVILPEMRQINSAVSDHIIDSADQLTGMIALAQQGISRGMVEIDAGQFDWQQPENQVLLILQSWLEKQHVYVVKDRQLQQVIQLMQNRSVAQGTVNLEAGLQLVREKSHLFVKHY